MKITRPLSAFLSLLLFAISYLAAVPATPAATNVSAANTDPTAYLVELNRFGIKNNQTAPEKTSAGLNKALQYAKEQGFSKITFPKGVYLISETNPIVIDLKNVVIDLNGSTLQINANGLEKYSIVEFRDGAENVRLTNGTVRGDKDTHNYLKLKTPHEWGCGVIFKSGRNLQMDNVTVTNVTGYGITTESGISANRFHRLFVNNLVQGSILDNGKTTQNKNTVRTVKPYDLSVCGRQFELGYTLGYQGYPYLQTAKYTAYFYNSQMKFIQKKECLQFRKVDIPSGAKYVHFVYPQSKVTGDYGGSYAWISNFRPPTNVRLANCLIKGNRSLGLGFCGGQHWTIENNIFEATGGNAPGYAIDFEDGWELMQDIVVKNNKFINNKADLVVCAGDNLSFEGNQFQKGAYIWERATNYRFKSNKFVGGSVTYRIKRAGCEVRNNQYINSNLRTASLSSLTFTLTNETLINSHVFVASGTKLINSTLQATGKPYFQNATMENCTLQVANAEASNLSLNKCLIKNSHMNLHTTEYLKNCTITNSSFTTHTDTTKIEFISSQFVNSQMMYTTSGAAAQIVLDQCKATMNTNLPLLRLSAGKTRNLVLKNSTITNQTAKPVIELYDTTYTVPKANVTIEGNHFYLKKNCYVIDGVNISKGTFNLKAKNNSITGAAILPSKYIGNRFFHVASK